MNIVPIQTTWKDLIENEWIAELDDTEFLTKCREGTVTHDEMKHFIEQQYLYSKHFTRYLCALLFNLSNESDRFALTENLFEEMGLGGLGNTPHSVIYRNMMEDMGIDPEYAEIAKATASLIDTMLGSCVNSNPLIGLAAIGLGAEAIVPHVYSQIVTGLQSLGISESQMEFFMMHIDGDDQHALTMFKIIEREISRDTFQRLAVRQTAQKIIQARTKFFADMVAVTKPTYSSNTIDQRREVSVATN